MMKMYFDKDSGEMLGIFDDAALPDDYDADQHEIIDLPVELTDGMHEWDPVNRVCVRHLETARHIALQTINTIRDNKQNGYIPTPFGLVDGSDSSKLKISGLVTMATILGPQFTTSFTLADDSELTPVDAEMMINLGLSVGIFVGQCHAHARALKAQVRAAETIADLDAIDLAAGWPGDD